MVSTVVTVHPSKPLESFLPGFSCSGEGPLRVDHDALLLLRRLISGDARWQTISTY